MTTKTKTTQPTTDELCLRLILLRQDLEEAKRAHDLVQAEIIDRGVDTATLNVGSEYVTCTVVRPEVVEIDEPALEAKVSRYRWNRVTKRVVDRTKLFAAVTAGQIAPEVAASAITKKSAKPYIKVTTKR